MPVLRWWSWGYGMRNECGHYACYFTSNGVVTGFRAKKFRCLAADFFVFAKTKASVLSVVPVSSHGETARSQSLSRLAVFLSNTNRVGSKFPTLCLPVLF